MKYTQAFIILLFLMSDVNESHGQNTVIGLVKLQNQPQDGHSGVTVEITAPIMRDTITAINGSYTFTNIGLNFYNFRYTKENYFPKELFNVLVDKSPTVIPTVNLDTIPDTHFVFGTALLPNRSEHSGISVTIRQMPGSYAHSLLTDSAGYFSIPFFTAGDYSITIDKFMFKPITQQITLLGDTTLQQSFLLDSGFVLQGVVTLEGSGHDTGATVLLSPAGVAVHDSTIADDSGFYAFTLFDSGYYDLQFKKDRFYTDYRESVFVQSILTLAPVTLDTVLTDTSYHMGMISTDTRWKNKTVHMVIGDIIVDSDISWIIEPGSVIKIAPQDSANLLSNMNKIEIMVKGKLSTGKNFGSSQLIFMASTKQIPAPGDWIGLQFASPDTSKLHRLSISHAQIGIRLSAGTHVIIDSCRIVSNLFGIQTDQASVQIQNSEITNNISGIIVDTSTSRIFNNTISNNSQNGIIQKKGEAVIFNNKIHTNANRGMDIAQAKTIIVNNSIVSNGFYAIVNFKSSIVVVNNILASHTSYAILNDTSPRSSNIEIAYNNFWANKASCVTCSSFSTKLESVNANGDTTDAHFNLYRDPQFSSSLTYALQDTSVCKGAAINTFTSTQLESTILLEGATPPDMGHQPGLIIKIINDLVSLATTSPAVAKITRQEMLAIPTPIHSLYELQELLKQKKFFFPYSYELHSAQGQKIIERDGIDMNYTKALLREVKPGLYFLVVRMDNKRYIKKVLILP